MPVVVVVVVEQPLGNLLSVRKGFRQPPGQLQGLRFHIEGKNEHFRVVALHIFCKTFCPPNI